MNPTSQPYNGGPDSAHPSTAGEDNPAPLGAHEALVSQPKPGDDPGEFGIGILPNPKARYWQGRAAFWRNEAIARGYKITEEPDPPRDTWQRELLALADEIDRQARECPTVDWRPSAHENARTLRELTRALSESAVGPLPAIHGDGGPEADFIADGEHLNCPACGGSGHVDDAAPASAPGGDIPVPWDECYSSDGDSWCDSPADARFVDGLKVGDTYDLTVSHWSITRTYVVTKAPDETSDDYEVKAVIAAATGDAPHG